MICGLAIPYEVHSVFPLKGKPCREVVSAGAFRESIQSGRSRSAKRIFACWGHKQRGRKDWRIADTASGLHLEDREDGVWFTLDGVDRLPMTFTGVSVRLSAIRWEKSGFVYRLLNGSIRHIAILTGEQPAYESTFLATIRASMRL